MLVLWTRLEETNLSQSGQGRDRAHLPCTVNLAQDAANAGVAFRPHGGSAVILAHKAAGRGFSHADSPPKSCLDISQFT